MMVVYDTGDGPSVREWICFEHTGYARKKAEAWWSRHSPGTQIPGSVAMALADSGDLRQPTEIEVRPDGAFFKVVSYRFPETEMQLYGKRHSAVAEFPFRSVHCNLPEEQD